MHYNAFFVKTGLGFHKEPFWFLKKIIERVNNALKKSKKTQIGANPKSKVMVLDTSVLMSNPYAIEDFGNNTIIIPIRVVEELDHLKGIPDYRGSIAREASRHLDKYRAKAVVENKDGSLQNGIKTDSGGILIIEHCNGDFKNLPLGLDHTNDNTILLVAKKWRSEHSNQVILVTNDINLRLKGSSIGIRSEEYQKSKIITDVRKLYTGLSDFSLNDKDLLELFRNNPTEIGIDIISKYINTSELLPNQCCTFRFQNLWNEEERFLTIYKPMHGYFKVIDKPRPKDDKTTNGKARIWPVNIEQSYAFALLMDPEIDIVTLIGIF